MNSGDGNLFQTGKIVYLFVVFSLAVLSYGTHLRQKYRQGL
jgi:hypothetical protein